MESKDALLEVVTKCLQRTTQARLHSAQTFAVLYSQQYSHVILGLPELHALQLSLKKKKKGGKKGSSKHPQHVLQSRATS